MTSIQLRQQKLFGLVLLISTSLFVIALGPGLFYGDLLHSWQHLIFDHLCHQDSHRSYHINGMPMAVCSRCFGIYSMFFIGAIGMPVFSMLSSFSSKQMFQILVGVLILNMVDVAGNAIGIWSNTLNSRFILGGLFGLTLSMLLSNEFFIKNTKSEVYNGQ